MNLDSNHPPAPEMQERAVNASWLWIGFIAILLFTVSELSALWISGKGQPWSTLPVIVAAPITYLFARRGKHVVGNVILMAAIGIQAVLTPLAQSGLGTPVALTSLALILTLGLAALPRRHIGRVFMLGTTVAIAAILVDLFGSPNRPAAELVAGRWVFSFIALAILGVYTAREFLSLDIRTKIVLGILLTGGIALGSLSFFALNRTGQLFNTLSDRVETSVNLLAEEQLINTVSTESSRANSAFDQVVSQAGGLASQLELLQEQKNALGDGTYWDANTSLIEYSNGQHYNSRSTPSSVFVPSTVTLDENVMRELNVTAYLDFSAPFILENNPQIAAVYYTNTLGIIAYYPNIHLGENLPHDYDGTSQPTYRVATPLFNPDKQTRWSFPRQDPAGTGLIISVSTPVYFKDEFKGVVTADLQLQRVAEQISTIRAGSTGYAFLVDSDGHIIAMPPEGYEFFKLQPEILGLNEEPRQTIFDGDIPFEIQQITNRMVVGGSGIITTVVGGVDYFVAYAPIANKSFSLGLIVPVAELTQPVITTRNEIDSQIGVAIRSAVVILIALLIGAVLVSLGLGQLIASPVLRLTQTANRILEGDLGAQAEVTTTDEIGTLAQAFNAMTARLRATFEGLEKNIEERTAQLVEANEANEKRAKQFQSIAHVARTISSTLDLGSLLTQITTVISREFGFYHVGVFLLDSAKEYAVLSAANSEGGQIMLARGHRLKVGEKGMVGFVSSTGKPRVALDTGADAVFFNNPDLPDTRSEIAMPLRAGELVFGVLDVQSTEPNAFSQEDVTILTTLADQVSIAIQNARQNEETRKALAESDALSRQFVQSGWSQFTKKEKVLGIRHTGARATMLYARNINGKGENPKSTGRLKSKTQGAVLSLPIKLRGEVIGSVDVRAPDNRKWDRDEMDIVSTIIERAAIALENARLLAESQKRAAKERTIGEISAKISAQSDVEELIKIAALELNRNLPDSEIAIQFKKEDAE